MKFRPGPLFLSLAAVLCLAVHGLGQAASALGPEAKKFVRVGTPRVVLAHVRILDGTGAPAAEDRNVTIENGKIAAISAGADVPSAEGTTVLDLKGYSVMPGIVGMHNHLFYLARPGYAADGSSSGPAIFQEMAFSATRLYLANGVTTMRTAGSIEPQTDVKWKRLIDTGVLPGPRMDVTGPYLDGPVHVSLQIRELTGPDDARATVAYWADRGVTSFKAYKNITRAELAAAVEEAHKRGLKVTGHLCSVTYEEAAEIGIDNLEHGFFVNTALDPGKEPDKCSKSQGDYTLEHMAPASAEANRLFATLLKHHVAITSTMPGTAAGLQAGELAPEGRPAIRPEVLEAMTPSLREATLFSRNRPVNKAAHDANTMLLRREMELERAFVAAGGLLMAGPDPSGLNGLIPGFGDQREIELLVEAGFSPVEAIRIATLNGATYLGRDKQIGSVAAGKNADLVVIKGDPSSRISDIENVEIVFKDGVGYDTARLLASVKGRYGEY